MQSIVEIDDSMIDLKSIELLMIDSMLIDSMLNDSMTIDSIELLIVVEKSLTELIQMFVDTSENVRTMIEKWFNAAFVIVFFSTIVHFQLLNCFWHRVDLDENDLTNNPDTIDVRSIDKIKRSEFVSVCFCWTKLWLW